MASFEVTKYGIKVRCYRGRDKNGKNVRESKTFKTRKEAERWAAEQLLLHDNMVSLEDSRMKLKDFMLKWHKDVGSKKSINTSYNSLSRMNQHIIPDIGHLQLNKLTNFIIQDFYNNLGDKDLKPSTKKKIMETLSNAMRYAMKLKLIPFLPTDIEKEPVRRSKINYWTLEEFTKFLEYVDQNWLYIPTYILGMTGMRPAELMGLQWKKMNLNNRIIEVDSQVVYDKKSKQLVHTDILKTDLSTRIITIPQSLTYALIRHKSTTVYNNPNDFVITTKNGLMSSADTLRTMFNKYVDKMRESQKIDLLTEGTTIDQIDELLIKKIPPYNLRHTHATMLLNNGENIKVISERLGHKSIKTTMDTYAQVMPKSKSRTADLLDELMNNT